MIDNDNDIDNDNNIKIEDYFLHFVCNSLMPSGLILLESEKMPGRL